tara:strand:- start:135 stop:1037 length:903 start_codon:yes stop_codon:yes gene_type:complete
MAGAGKAIQAGAKVLKKLRKTSTQTRKQVSKEGFDNSKVKTGNVKVTKIKKPTTGNARKTTGLNKKTTATPKKTAVKKTTTKKRTNSPRASLSTAQRKANDAAVKKGGTALAKPKAVKKVVKAPVKKAPVKKTAKKTARKTPAKKVAKKKTAKKTTTSTPRNARGTSERAGIGGGRSTKDTLKGSSGKQETRLAIIDKKPKKTKKKPSYRGGKKDTDSKAYKAMRKLAAKRKPRKKLIKRAKQIGAIAKKSKTGVIAGGAGYLGGRMGSSGNVADAAQQSTTGFTQAELDAARMRYYGGR